MNLMGEGRFCNIQQVIKLRHLFGWIDCEGIQTILGQIHNSRVGILCFKNVRGFTLLYSDMIGSRLLILLKHRESSLIDC